MMPLRDRLQLLLVALLLCVPLAYFVLPWYTRYWLTVDGTEGTALVTEEGSHGSVYYTYVVADRTYRGHSQTNWRDDRYRHVNVGERPPVWYSASHPWLSMLYMPDFVAVGLLGALFIFVFQALIIISAFWPALGRKIWLGRRARYLPPSSGHSGAAP
jgi:hypothetical protein